MFSSDEAFSSESALVLCMTPLHVLICEAIAAQAGRRFDTGLYVTEGSNKKHQAYYARMAEFCRSAKMVEVPPLSELSRIKHIALYRQRRYLQLAIPKASKHAAMLLPSSITDHVYVVASKVNAKLIYTFDDGLLNIQPNSLIRAIEVKRLKRLQLSLMGVKTAHREIISNTRAHFTLYTEPNAYPRTRLVSLKGISNQPEAGSNQSHVRIVLGSAPEASPDVWRELADIASRCRVDGFLPHPRDTADRNIATTIRTDLIAEDYVLGELKAGHSVHLVGAESSALVNLAKTDGVRCYSTVIDQSPQDPMALLMKRCGVLPASLLPSDR